MNKRAVGVQVIIVLSFLALAFIYCAPVMQGKTLLGHDLESWNYMAKETMDYNARGEGQTFWTNSMFGGMPNYQIAAPMGQYNVLSYVRNALGAFPFPVSTIFMYLLGAYILLLCFRINKWIAAIGAVALGFVSYNFIILVAGHVTKANVIGYMMPLVGSVYLLFRGNKWAGAILTALFLALAIMANHVQILYYTLFIVLIFGLIELVYAIRGKQLRNYMTSVGLGICALLIAVGLNAPGLASTYQYSKATMRGESNGLSNENKSAAGHGLDKDYITAWSYGVDESMTLLVPDFKGGASGGTLSANSETAQKLKAMGVPNIEETMKDFQLPLYWGTQPFTSGPVYLGAIVCFLFVLGLFLVEKRTKWWLVSVTVLTLMLAWGHNFMPLTDFFIDYVPMYNKFRTVSMILVATCLCMGLLGMLGLKAFFDPELSREKAKRSLKYALYITGGLALLFWIVPSLSGSFVAQSDRQLGGEYSFLRDTLPADRMALLRHDALRSLIFIVLTFGVLWMYLVSKLKLNMVYALLFVLVLADMWAINKRYLSDKDFTIQKKTRQQVQPSAADQYILNDKSYYRVLDATVNIFNDARPAYFHKSIGGYHAAKLSRYQELIDYHLEGEIQMLLASLKNGKFEEFPALMKQLGVLDMLNMKYLIYNPNAQPLVNPEANGNAWFVDSYRLADNADEEIQVLGEIDTKREFVADKQFAAEISSIQDRDTTATILLKSYAPNRLVYDVNTQSDQVAVFSEIYYKDGWNAYVNGQKVPYFRANYLLRAMPLKAGRYEVEFRFEPSVVSTSMMVSLISSVLLILLAGVAFYFGYWKKTTVK